MLAFPMHPNYIGYYEPLEQMPDSVKELFTYNPAKAKQLLAEAGYPNGFTLQGADLDSASIDDDLLQMVAAYLAKVGVKMEIQVLEYAAYLSAMMTKTNAPGYFMFSSATPTRRPRCARASSRARSGTRRSSATPRSTRRWPRSTPSPTSACARSRCG